MFGFWTAIVIIVAIVFFSITVWVKLSYKHEENIKRIKHGYPTLDGSVPINSKTIDDENERLQ